MEFEITGVEFKIVCADLKKQEQNLKLFMQNLKKQGWNSKSLCGI